MQSSFAALRNQLAIGLAVLSAACVAGVARAGASVWDSRTGLFGTPSAGEGTAESRLRGAFGQFAEWSNWIEIVLAAGIAVGLATLLAYHPRGSRRKDRVEALEERKTLVVLGLVGAVVSGLVQINPAMALVVFGIGGLMRFRTVLATPHLTGRAILVVVVGLAAGMSQFVTAIVIAGIGWSVIWWLHAHRFVRIKIRVTPLADRDRVRTAVAEALGRMHCRVASVEVAGSGRSMTMTTRVPATVADELLQKGLGASLPADLGVAGIQIKDE